MPDVTPPPCPRCDLDGSPSSGAALVETPGGGPGTVHTAPRVRVLYHSPGICLQPVPVWVCRTCHQRVWPAAEVTGPAPADRTAADVQPRLL